MKSYLQMLIVFAALGLILGCAASGFAQTDVPMAGSYQNVDVSDSQIVEAAKFAVKAQAKKQKAKIKLSAISKAEQQVVAGMNYRLCLQVQVTEKDKKTAVPQTIQIVVFRSLKQKYELTSWAIAACTDEMPPVAPVK